MDKDEIILMVKKAIANNSLPFEDSDEFVELDGFDVDNIADEVYEALYNAGYRKIPKYAVIIPAEEREAEMKATNEILAERDGLKAEIERLKAENEKLKMYNDKLCQGIYWGNGKHFSNAIEIEKNKPSKSLRRS